MSLIRIDPILLILINQRKTLRLITMSIFEKVLYWTICLTPIWWLSGIQVLLYPTVVFIVLILNFDFNKLIQASIPQCVWSWLLMTLIMLWTAIMGLYTVDFAPLKAAAAFVMLYKSYLLIFASLLLPFFCRIRVRIVTRATAWLSSGFLATLAIEIVMLLLKIGGTGYLPLLSKLIPGDKQSLRVTFAVWQPFFGIPIPRTVLYTADPPIVGVCAILFFFICLGETNLHLRRAALTGCLVALVFSQSRLAWICFPLILALMGGLRNNWIRQGFLWTAALTSLASSFLGITFKDLLTQPMDIFTKARPESSTDREVVVRKTLEAWQEKPWLGWGTVQGSVQWHIYDIALGAFSTYPSVLYLHGIVGLVVFLFAQFSTIVAFWENAVQGSVIHQRAIASLLGLYILCSGMPFTWMVIYFWFFFIWLGAILAETQQQEHLFLREQQLTQWVG
jgi:O-antigen ligase